MKYFHIEGTINEDLLNRFLQFCNDYENEDWTFVINSRGGKNNCTRVIIHTINERSSNCRVISMGAYSAAFDILYFTRCKKLITQRSLAMIHRGSAEMSVMSNNKPSYPEDESIVKNWKHDYDIEFASKILTASELKKFKKGDDIFFSFERIIEIFPDAEII